MPKQDTHSGSASASGRSSGSSNVSSRDSPGNGASSSVSSQSSPDASVLGRTHHQCISYGDRAAQGASAASSDAATPGLIMVRFG